ncbi:MAG: DUF2232 domain-containing protein [Desulfobacteraceae bacterium]|nr:DUF2232 domain-containing protein [Desulfobacteraceae bacterium]
MGISLCILIFAIIFAFPLLGVFALLFLPLPVLFYRLKLGRNSSSAIMVISFLVLAIMTRGVAFDILYFGSLLMVGFILGECIERHLSIERTMIFTGLTIMGSAAVAFLLYTMFQDRTISAIVSDYLTHYFNLTTQLYTDMGIEQSQIKMLNSAFLLVLPGMFTVSFMTTIWINILIIKRLLLKKGIALKSIENLNQYKAPDHLVWLVIVLGMILFLPMEAPKYVSVNCLIVLMLVYFFQGIAVVSFFFQKKKSPVALRFFCYSLIAVQLYFLILVIGLGFFDNWIDFRKIGTQKQ